MTSPTPATPTLMPCAHCGKPGELRLEDSFLNGEEDWAVHCEKCPSSVRGLPTEIDAILAWNTRALSPALTLMPEDKPPEKLSTVMYFLTKTAARDSFSGFLDFCGVTYDEWKEMTAWLNKHGIKTYL